MIRQPKCLWCSGLGKVWAAPGLPVQAVALGLKWALLDERRCEPCDGTGRVPIVTWIGQKIALWRIVRRYS